MHDTTPRRFFATARAQGTRPAYFVSHGGRWVATSWEAFALEVRAIARGLIAAGLEPGDRMAILGYNRPEWVVCHLACMAAAGVPVGIYRTASAEDVRHLLAHAGARFLVLEKREDWRRAQGSATGEGRLETVVLMSEERDLPGARTLTWRRLLDRGRELEEARLDERLGRLRGEALASLIYTSGTDGTPKGVMLSHGNLAWMARTMAEHLSLGPADSNFSYLPLSHIIEQLFTIHTPAYAGYAIYYADDPQEVVARLQAAQPTILCGVPRVWEKLHEKTSARLAAAGRLRRLLVRWASGVATRVVRLRARGRRPGAGLDLQHRLATRMVFSKLKPRLGLGRARLCASGAAPIAREILDFFAGLDIPIYEVYGLSESSGPVTLNSPGATRFGTVGAALPGTELRIADDGEVLTRGPHVFQGYYRDRAATRAALAEGWLHTGDLGALDRGYLSIAGRKKDILITSGGKNVAPAKIEAALSSLELVEDAVVVGNGRKHLAALLTLDPVAVANALREPRAAGAPDPEDPRLRSLLEAGVAQVNARLARPERIRRFRILPASLTIEGGELTPSLKVRRHVVEAKYSAAIDALYADGGESSPMASSPKAPPSRS